MIKAEIDLTEFEKAMELAVIYSSRSTAEVMNGYCLDVILKSAKAIPKADRGKMERQLTGRIEVETLTKSGNLRKNPKITRHPSKLVYNIINARRRKQHRRALTGKEMADAAKNFMKARLSSIGYIAYGGFQKANLAFGGRGFGQPSWRELSERSHAAEGWGRPARHDHLVAEFVNRATGAYKVGGSIVQGIVNARTDEIYRHLEEKLAKQFERL